MNTPCKIPECVGVAESGGLCAPHAAGYRLHDKSIELRCDNCRKLIGAEWYQRTTTTLRHAKDCATHPDVVKEREKATA